MSIHQVGRRCFDHPLICRSTRRLVLKLNGPWVSPLGQQVSEDSDLLSVVYQVYSVEMNGQVIEYVMSCLPPRPPLRVRSSPGCNCCRSESFSASTSRRPSSIPCCSTPTPSLSLLSMTAPRQSAGFLVRRLPRYPPSSPPRHSPSTPAQHSTGIVPSAHLRRPLSTSSARGVLEACEFRRI